MAKQASKTKSRPAARAKKATKSVATRRKAAAPGKTARSKTVRSKTGSRTKAAPRRAAVTPRQAPQRRSFASKVSAFVARAAQELKAGLAVTEMPDDAITLLQQDHRKVESLFEEFENTQSKTEKSAIAGKICLELRVHTQIEEELLYPPAHREIEHDLIDEAVVEHASAKELIYQIEAMSPSDHLYDAKVKVLSEYIKHHVKEEESEMFPKLRGRDLNLHEMAVRMHKRKAELIRGYAKSS